MRYFNRHTERMDSSTMSRLPMTDGIYLGDNLLVPPMPPIPTIATPWLQFDANGGLVATDLTGLRNATRLMPSGVVTGITSVNLDLPDATNLSNVAYSVNSLETFSLYSDSENISDVTYCCSNNAVLREARIELPNYRLNTQSILRGNGGNLQTATLLVNKSYSVDACFHSCAKLTQVVLEANLATNLSNMFADCRMLEEFAGNFPELTSYQSNHTNNTSLKRFNVVWGKISNCTGAFTNSGLETDEINKILTSLPTYTSGSHVITFTGCPGAPTCDTSIGTNKGWTVQI